MRNIAFLCFLLFTNSAIAITPGEFIGRSTRGTTFVLVMDGGWRKPPSGSTVEVWQPTIYIYRAKKSYTNQLPSNCSLPGTTQAEWHVMECEKDASTLLSNVKYKVIQHANGKVEMRCLAGCSSQVPRVFKYVESSA